MADVSEPLDDVGLVVLIDDVGLVVLIDDPFEAGSDGRVDPSSLERM